MSNQAVYLSGGMTNLPSFNFPMFDSCAAALRREGYTVYSPAENDRRVWAKLGVEAECDVPGFATGDVVKYSKWVGDTKDLFRWDFGTINYHCDGIVMLPGWEKSSGARWERVVAEALGLRVLLAHDLSRSERIGTWAFTLDSEQDRLSRFLRQFAEPGLTGVVG
jgi:hypothetical protein